MTDTMPWEDYQGPQTQTGGPWEDYQGPQTQTQPELSTGENIANKAQRFGLGVASPFVGGMQRLAHITGMGQETMDSLAQSEEDKENSLKAAQGYKKEELDPWHIGGQALPWVAGTIAAPEVTLGGRLVGLTGLAAKGAAQGLAGGLTSPISNITPENSYASQSAQNALTGTITGGIASPAIGIAGRTLAPIASKAEQVMTQYGIPTPSAVFNRYGSIAKSEPLTGGMVSDLEHQFQGNVQKGAANKILSNIDESVDPGIQIGTPLQEHVHEKINTAYNNALQNASLGMKDSLDSDLGNTLLEASKDLPSEQMSKLENLVNNQIYGKIESVGGTLDGNSLQGITSMIKREARGYGRATESWDNQKLSQYINKISRNVYDAVEDQNSPEVVQMMKKANSAYREFLPFQKAGSYVGTPEGEFAPSQLYRASIAGQNPSTINSGNAPLQNIASAAKELTRGRVADSGTATRLTALNELGHLGYSGMMGFLPAAMNIGTYNPLTQAFLGAMKNPGPKRQMIRNIMDRYASTVAGRLGNISNQ